MNITDVTVELKCFGESNRRYSAIFIERRINKPFNDLRSYRSNREDQWKPISYKQELFSNMLQDCFLIVCLVKKKKKKKIGIRPGRLLQLVKEKDRSWIPRNDLN